MEAKYKAAEREMWRHYREAEMKRHRREREHGEDRELEELKAGIEERLRHHGEELRRQLAAGEITQEEMKAKYKAAEREMWRHYREAEMKRHRGDGEHGEGDGNAPRYAYMHRIREIEEAMRSGKISREEGTRAIEETKRSLEQATRDGQETSSTSPRKDDARTSYRSVR